MFKSKNPGLAIVETILVIAISGVMFVVVIGLFATRKRTQSDDGARQVLSIIAKVRNEAQSGKGPTTDAGKNLLKCNDSRVSTCSNRSNEIFGEAIKFYTNSLGSVSNIQVLKLMQNPNTSTKLISAYEVSTIQTPGGLLFYAPGSAPPSATPSATPVDCATVFYTCYMTPGQTSYADTNGTPIALTPTETITLVFRNRTGESYVFVMNDTISQYTGSASTTGWGNYKVTPDLDSETAYTSDRQGKLRLALFGQGTGTNLNTKAESAAAKYYINFDLSVPNNQSLEVVQ